MAQGVIPITSIPGWPSPPDGIMTLLAEITPCFVSPDGLHADDVDAAQDFLDAFVGSASQLEYNKDAWLTNLATLYADKYATGFNYDGYTFQIDARSQGNIDGQATAALGSILNGEVWDANSYFVAADNSRMPLPTAEAARMFSLAAHNYIADLILNNRKLKDEINGATTMAELEIVDINSGWPANEMTDVR
jgi:hypothetical protein